MAEKNSESIVVLGAGFGGLRTAISIAKKTRKEVILIDRNDYQTFTPTLYEIAATSKETANYLDLKKIVTFPIQELIRKYPIKFVQTNVETIDLINGDIHCSGNLKLKFDYLVLALGSETNYFDIPGLRENSLPLKTFMDALAIRNRIFNAVSDLSGQDLSGQEGKENLKILIGGGGSTGVELAGELQEWLCELKKEIQKPVRSECDANITIVEGAPSILYGFDERIIRKAIKRLRSLGTEFINNEIIEKVIQNKVITKSGREIFYDILIWAGGVQASSLLRTLPLKTEAKKHQIVVAGKMECLPETPDLRLYGKIYGLGDSVCFFDPITEKPVPKVARAALLQADVVAHNIAEDIKGGGRHKIYMPREYPYVISVGGKFAVAKINRWIISGLAGWILKGLVELNYMISIMGVWKALNIWIKGIKIFIKNDRLG